MLHTFVCFHCGEKSSIESNVSPCYAFEAAEMAKQAGMLGVIDMRYNRTLFFCNDECSNAEKTKRGLYRLRPKGKKTASTL